MDRYFISFLGSHDLGTIDNGPIVSLLGYVKPTHIYLFITKGYVETNNIESLREYYKKYTSYPINIIETNIEDPTNHKEIYSKIIDSIEGINNDAKESKSQVFINLTSGTPAIISVLSLLSMTGFVNRAIGVYAPNPKFDNMLKVDTLDFYKNSFAYNTLKTLINNKEYDATLRFLEQNKILKNLSSDKEFMDILNFANQRIMGNFEKAYELYQDIPMLHSLEYKNPTNLYEIASEYYISAQVAIAKNDSFQSILKLGIIREILTSFLCQKLLKESYTEEIIIYDTKEERPPRFNLDNLNTYGQDLKEYIINTLSNSKLKLKFDFSREVNAYTEGLILEYLLEKGNTSNLAKIKRNFHILEELKGERNKLAHRLSTPQINKKWNASIKDILILIAEEFSYSQPDFSSYKEINEILLTKLKQALN